MYNKALKIIFSKTSIRLKFWDVCHTRKDDPLHYEYVCDVLETISLTVSEVNSRGYSY